MIIFKKQERLIFTASCIRKDEERRMISAHGWTSAKKSANVYSTCYTTRLAFLDVPHLPSNPRRKSKVTRNQRDISRGAPQITTIVSQERAEPSLWTSSSSSSSSCSSSSCSYSSISRVEQEMVGRRVKRRKILAR